MATITRRNPSRVLTVVEPHYHPYDFTDEIEMLARDLWEQWPESYGTTDEGLPMEMFEQKDELIMRTELPGVGKQDIDVCLEGDLLTIKAEKKQPELREDATYYFCERCFGSYSRSIRLPFAVDSNKISTTFENGVLEIRLPKSAEAKAKHIDIKVGSTPRQISSKSK